MVIHFIWTITRVCAWSCYFCCVNAFHISKSKNRLNIKAKGYKDCISISENRHETSIYELASKRLQSKGLELTLKKKLTVIENLKGITPFIDFSGGDLLLIKENIKVIERAAKLFGKQNISISTTGLGLTNFSINKFSKIIGELDFTYDNVYDEDDTYRQNGYNKMNLLKARCLVNKGVRIKALTPLSKTNINPEVIKKIFLDLHKAKVDEILLMRIFPVGRGMVYPIDLLDKEEYLKAINQYFELEKKFGKPKVILQCALKNLRFNRLKDNPCELLAYSLGITSNGLLLLSPWAYNAKGNPISKDFIIGDLTKENILEIYKKRKIKEMLKKIDNNFGHCKVFSYLNSKEKNINQIFSKSDPLYIK